MEGIDISTDIDTRYAKAATRLSLLQRLFWLYEWQDSIPAQSSEALEEKPLVGVWEGLLESDDVLEDPIVLGEISTSRPGTFNRDS